MRVENLSELLKLIVEAKTNEYGPASVGMQKIADAWSSLLGVKIRPHQVALMYATAKIVRAFNNYKSDNYVDLINYANIADEIQKEDVSEYKEGR